MKVKILLFILFYFVWVLVALAISFGLFTVGQPAGVIPLPAIIVYIVAIMVPIWFFTRWLNAPPGWTKKVMEEGKTARATVTSVGGGGFRVNGRIVWTIKMRVERLGEEPFEAKLEKMSWLPTMSEGEQVQVKYDPDHRSHVVILNDAGAAGQMSSGRYASSRSTSRATLDPELEELMRMEEKARSGASGTNISDELSKLAQLHKSGDLTDAEFESAKKKLLG